MNDDPGIEKAQVRTKRPYNRRPVREDAARAPARDLHPGQYRGRNGEVLTRKVTSAGDQFEVPAHLKEKGWDYQWLTENVYNNPDIVRRHNHQMYQAGWRPVLATGRWNGVFGPPEDVGHIRIGDSGFYERPLGMTKDARAEEIRRAHQQMRDRDESLMGGKANIRGAIGNGNGIEMGGKYRGTGAQLRMSIDPALDVPMPSHELATGEE